MIVFIYALATNVEIFAASCKKTFLGIPPWYKYLPTSDDAVNQCVPVLKGLNDIWLIGLAFIEILARVAIYVAIGFTIYAGIKYSASRGNTDKVNSAKYTLLDALTGLVIAIVAAAVVSFVAERISQA
ncbi:hypothetical protein HZB74_03560 [Candidatus Saccharibacteria bacterium]|nr:hypothetical protein [Candidatus Saccharibacteria bacterium]